MYLIPVNAAEDVKTPPNSPGFARLVALWQSVHSLSPWRGQQRALECGPERRDVGVVGRGAGLLAGVDVAHVEHRADRRVLVDGVDEGRALVALPVVVGRARGRARRVGRVAVGR